MFTRVARALRVWETVPDSEAQPLNGGSPASPLRSDVEPQSLTKQLWPWYVGFLVLQAILLFLRWRLGDAHGALLMFVVVSIGAIAGALEVGGIDPIYGGYYGLMAFVSGLLDLNICIEKMVTTHWHVHEGNPAQRKHDATLSAVQIAIFFACAVVQLASSFIAYLMYKEAEALEEEEEANALNYISEPQARIYSAVLRHTATDRRAVAGTHDSCIKAFDGSSHKLP